MDMLEVVLTRSDSQPGIGCTPVLRMAHWAKFPTVKPQAKNLLVAVPAEGRLSHANVERSDGVVIVINGKKLCSNEPVWWSYAQ